MERYSMITIFWKVFEKYVYYIFTTRVMRKFMQYASFYLPCSNFQQKLKRKFLFNDIQNQFHFRSSSHFVLPLTQESATKAMCKRWPEPKNMIQTTNTTNIRPRIEKKYNSRTLSFDISKSKLLRTTRIISAMMVLQVFN